MIDRLQYTFFYLRSKSKKVGLCSRTSQQNDKYINLNSMKEWQNAPKQKREKVKSILQDTHMKH